MKSKIIEAKKKKSKLKKGEIKSMGASIGNRVTGKIMTPKGEVSKMPY